MADPEHSHRLETDALQDGAKHHHAHAHRGISHTHAPADFGGLFAIAMGLNLLFVAIETLFGFIANSMSLLADAGHNLSDVLGLLVAWAGATMARRAPSPRFTYGLKKAPILAALANSLFLLVAIGAIGAEAIRRLFHPSPTQGPIVIAVACAGILLNGMTAMLFARGHHDINVRSAFLHMLADAAVSAGVALAGLMILWTGQQWLDPATSLVIALVILWGSIGLFKESVWMSLAGVPSGIILDEVEEALVALEGVEAVHDLHVWPLSTTETALTAHIVTARADYPDLLLANARLVLHQRFRIEHCTIQVEREHTADHKDC